jgi:hypothetical protein
MTAEERQAVEAEIEAVAKSLERSLGALVQSAEAIRAWAKGRIDVPPPRDLAAAGLDVTLDIMALYRARLWLRRFG